MRICGAFVTAITAFVGLAGCASAPRADTHADAEAVRELDRRWIAAMNAKNVEPICSLFAPDAIEMPANTPRVVGREAICTWYKGWLLPPGVTATFTPEVIEVAASGDLAFERGTYRFATEGQKGHTEDVSKYLTVWKNVGGEWKVFVDMGNTDLPLAVP